MEAQDVRVLLIEDDPDDALLMEKLLVKSCKPSTNFLIERADRIEKALRSVIENNFQLIVMDLTLPDGKGLETFEKIHEAAPTIPIIICSGLTDRTLALEAIGKGAQDYVIKGEVDQRTLEKVILYALERRHVQEMKEEFVGMVVHELRSPLAISRASIELLLNKVPESQQRFLSMSIESMERLNRLIDNLMEVTTLELGKVKLTKGGMDINALARDICASFEPLARQKGLELKNNFPAEKVITSIDKDKITEVWMNLVSNAVKFTEKGSIEMSIIDKGNEVECGVSDTGCGISEDKLEKLFGKFQKFRSEGTAGEKGTGLGLAISKGIITAHGGKIWAESRPGQGSRFLFTLPVR